jgi:hypothetical protein
MEKIERRVWREARAMTRREVIDHQGHCQASELGAGGRDFVASESGEARMA